MTSWKRSRHTTSGNAVGPVLDLFLNDVLAWLVPTHPATHLYKVIVGSLLVPLVVYQSVLRVVVVGHLLVREEPAATTSAQDTQRVVAFVAAGGAVLLYWLWQRRILWMLWYRPPWMDPTVMDSGPRLTSGAVCNLRFYTNLRDARAAACSPEALSSKSPHVYNLDGSWDFSLCHTVQDGLALASSSCNNNNNNNNKNLTMAQKITVPSNWMLQPNVDDIPRYTNQKYPIPCQPPLVPIMNPTGVYRRQLPANIFYSMLQGDTYWLHIHGAESMVYVYVNGQQVGFAKDSRLPSSWDISTYLRPCDNFVTLVVIRWCDGTYLEDQDHWHMAGLHRSVELVRCPARAAIRDVWVQQATHVGQLQVRVALNTFPTDATDRTTQGNTSKTKLRFTVYNDQSTSPDGNNLVWSEKATVEEDISISTDSSSLTWTQHISQVKPWTAETPHLYTLVVSLLDDNGDILQVESTRIGFRSVSIHKGQVCWNDKPITICGMNRHEHDPDTGKVVSLARMHQDVVTLKQNNFNAVRTSHYPQHPSFYKLCDYYGLYVVDEANLETHGMRPMGRLVHDRQGWETTILPRITRLIQRDKNHACILAWSLGNEAGRGRNLWTARKKVMQMDTSRLVVYESGGLIVEGTGRTELTDVICTMYPHVPRTLALATREDEDRPVVLCEYSHAMGNSNGNLHLYWKEFWDKDVPRLQGGFIWDMIDQGLRQTDKKSGREYFAYGGDFGDEALGTDYQFCINGMFSPEREPHPAVNEIKFLMQPAIFRPNEAYTSADCVRIAVNDVCGFHMTAENRYAFSSLEHVAWNWSLTSNRSADPIRRSSFELSDPHGEKEVFLNLASVASRVEVLDKSRPFGGHSYYLNLYGVLRADTTWAKAGHVLVTQQFPLKFIFGKGIPRKVSEPSGLVGQVGWRIHDAKVLIECCKSEDTIKLLTLDPRTGGLESYFSSKGENMLHETLLPNFVRAATDNDKGGFEQPIEFLFPGTNYEILFGVLHNVDEFSYWARWKHVGLDASAPPRMECVDLRMRRHPSQCRVHARAYCHVINPKHKTTLFDVQVDYDIWGDGRVRVHYRVEPTAALRLVSSLPRVGASLALTPPYDSIAYFGRGPHENYPDRKSSASLGLYKTTPHSMGYANYIVPGENGSRSDCEWISFRRRDGHGLLVCAGDDKTFSCSALPYHVQELDQAKHTYELPVPSKSGEHPVYVNIDARIMGLGGDTSWNPVVYPEYRVDPRQAYEYSIWLIPLSPDCDEAFLSRDDPREVSSNG